MKKLFFSFFFIIIIIKNIPGSFTTNLGPIQIITSNGLNTFTAGTIKLFGQIYIGLSTSDNIKIKGNQITYPDTGNTAILMIQNDGSIITESNIFSLISCRI